MTTDTSLPTYSSSDRLWSIFCHLSFLLGLGVISFVFPLAVYLAMKRDSPFVAHHAREALNFHLSLLLYVLLCVPLFLIIVGGVLVGAVMIFGLVCSIIAAVHCSNGVYYRYPLTIHFVR
jgi:uncharacterized Tic20 family protein